MDKMKHSVFGFLDRMLPPSRIRVWERQVAGCLSIVEGFVQAVAQEEPAKNNLVAVILGSKHHQCVVWQSEGSFESLVLSVAYRYSGSGFDSLRTSSGLDE